MNILNNAQQAIDGAGEIFISTCQESAGIVCVTIRDSGCGISEEAKKKIFDPFFTTKAPGVGTGLGLSVSYGIISRLNGSIECNSTPGQGTEFKVRFPRVSLEKQGSPEEIAKMVGAI
jgi:signal transduction histidine kinase